MSTNKIALRTIEEFMSGYVPVYTPIYTLFLAKGQQYSHEVGKMDFRRVETVGDIRGKHISPKSNSMQQVTVTEGKKTFSKYFLANQFIHSDIQDARGVEDVAAQVLDEHQIHADELFLLGEGTAANNVVNNGLFHSADKNYVLEASVEIAAANRLSDLHSKMMVTAEEANRIAGQKVLIYYGDTLRPVINSIYEASSTPFKKALKEVLEDYTVIQLPKDATPAGQNGWMIANLDQTKLHYTALPQILAQGHNEEKMYVWTNFFLGSMMLEVIAKGGVIRQPVTFEV